MSSIELFTGTADNVAEAMLTMNEAFLSDFGEAWSSGQMLSMLSLPDTWLLLARIDGRRAGFALSRTVADEAELLLLAVTPHEQRKHVGQALIERTTSVARLHSAVQLHLEVRENNPALAFYRNAGFYEVGRRKGYYRGANGDVFDALTLRCSIT